MVILRLHDEYAVLYIPMSLDAELTFTVFAYLSPCGRLAPGSMALNL